MDLTSGCPFWQVRDGLPAAYPALDRDLDTEVVVVGAGATGALIAWQLVEAGFSTVLVDRREVGWGSTAATTALLTYELDTSLVDLAAAAGRETAERIYRATHAAVEAMHKVVSKLPDSSELVRRPSLYLASTRKDAASFPEECGLRQSLGIDVELWSSAQLETSFGIKRPAALYSRDAAEVDPYRLTHALIRSACRRGLIVSDRTPVRLPAKRIGGRFRLRVGGRWTVRCRELIVATGYETQALLRQRNVRLQSTYAFASEPLDPADLWPGRCLIWESARPYLYLRTTGDSRVMAGGEDVDHVDADSRDRLIPAKTRALRRRARALFPQLGLAPAFSWTGTFAESDDGLPFIGVHPRLPGARIACCYGGNGLLFGVLAAEIVTAAVRGDGHPDAALFSFDRPTSRAPLRRRRARPVRRR
jgi:glycine/D-amino acid oxidase-like deaminating enzyme